MTSRIAPYAAALAILAAACAPRAHAQLTLPTHFVDSLVVGGLSAPVDFAFVPDAPGLGRRVLFVEQKTARVRLVVNGALAPVDPIGTVPLVQTAGNEQGLLSIAVDPRWPQFPYVYMHYNSTIGKVRLSRFKLAGDLAFTGNGQLTMDPATRYDLLTDIPDSFSNHNGGALRFAPDKMLYFSLGEDFQACLSQDTTSFLGKLLRLDVTTLSDSAGGPPAKSRLVPQDNPHASSPHPNWRLVHSLGFRNPFRFHIDPADGAIFVADVGEITWEEVDRITGPSNLGWPYYEADTTYRAPGYCTSPVPASPVFPIARYPHPTGRSIISLGVYRRPAEATWGFPPEYEGAYFYSDYYSGLLRRLVWNGTSWTSPPVAGQPNAWDWASGAQQVSEGLVGPDGALWYCAQSVQFGANSGSLRRVVYTGPPLDAPPPGAPIAFAAPWPSPSSGPVSLAFTLPAASRVELSLLDASGRLVRVLERGERGAGAHTLTWDGRDGDGRRLHAGVYWARLVVDGAATARRVIRLP